MRNIIYIGLAAIASVGVWLWSQQGDVSTASVDNSAIEALQTGDMRKLQFHSTPKATSSAIFLNADGSDMTLAAFEGHVTLVNFWATWCAPCRKEMPELSALQTAMGGDTFEVVTIATGVNPAPAMTRFFNEINVTNLPLHTDLPQTLARDMGVLGLPVTVILDASGFEIARLQGDADWASESAMAVLAAVIAAQN